MQINDLLGDLLGDSPEISPILAPISPILAQRESPETGHLSPFSPFSPAPTADDKKMALDPGRTWAPGNQYICECGHATGWLRDGRPLCPMCDTTPAPAGAITTEADHIRYVATAPGQCPLCGVPLNQDGGHCWHRAFHCGLEKAAGAPSDDEQTAPAPATCRCQISPVALAWLQGHRQQLRAAGWTMADLYRRNKSRGIAWVGLWDMPGLSVAIESGGAISFNFQDVTGKRLRQTAWPRKHHRKRSTQI